MAALGVGIFDQYQLREAQAAPGINGLRARKKAETQVGVVMKAEIPPVVTETCRISGLGVSILTLSSKYC